MSLGVLRNTVLLCVYLVGVAGILPAQYSDLPKLYPSYVEDFQEYKSFPSVCFEDVYQDSNGRFWLANCKAANQVNLHLFQFDGYQFKIIKGELGALSHRSEINGFTTNNKAVGTYKDNTSHKVFFFDLATETIDFISIQEGGNISDLVVRDDGRIFCVVEVKGEMSCFEIINRKLVFINKLKADYQIQEGRFFYTPNLRFLNGETLWQSENGQALERIQISADRIQKSVLQLPLIPEKSDTNPVAYYFYSTLLYNNGKTYIKLKLKDKKWSLYQVDDGSTTIDSIDFFPDIYQDVAVFKDDIGNLLFLKKEEFQKEYQSILVDTNGQVFDYSAFFEQNKNAIVFNIVGKDFKRELTICNTKGFIIQKVKSNDAIQNYLKGISTRSIAEMENQQYYIAPQSFDKFILDKKNQRISTIQFDSQACNLGYNKIHVDKDGFLWGTRLGTVVKYDPRTNSCEVFPVKVKSVNNFVFTSPDELILLYNRSYLATYNLKTQEFSPFQIQGQPLQLEGFIHDIQLAKGQLLWAATTAGLYKINLATQKVDLFGKEPPFSNSRFLCLDLDERGRIWLGTPYHGLQIFDPATNTLTSLNSDQGLANNTVVSIVKDDDGDRWLGTYNGVALVNSEGELITNLGVEDGIVERESNRYSKLKGSDGTIFIGTVNGLSVIDPKLVKGNMGINDNLKIYLTRAEYFDAETNQNRIIQTGLSQLTTIQLAAANRNLSLNFANSNFYKPKENKYAYMIEGLDDDWVELGNQNSLILNRIPPGNHRLLIKSSDGISNWTPTPLEINIFARAFFYNQVWFYLLIALILVAGVFLWIRNLGIQIRKATRTIKADKEVIEAQAEQLKELDIAKSKFFTNISHEFRTPLTVIQGMNDQILKKQEKGFQKEAKLIKRNTNQLLELVNQILDLRKLESSELKVNMIQGDVVAYLRYLLESFHSFAEDKGIQTHFLSDTDQLLMDYDPEKLFRIVSNLISNAIKFTPEGGDIYLRIDEREQLIFQVADTGMGIPTDKLPYIFERFYQVNDSSTREGEGTGVGLALTQELVHLLGGSIQVISKEGRGTTFTIKLPIHQNAPLQELPKQTFEQANQIASAIIVDPNLNESSGTSDVDLENPSLLIVEDNADVVLFLESLLANSYQLLVARNGQEGIEQAIEHIPDLIISDVMMPKKNGYELCETLKLDDRTSHIPIVLLTAKADSESKIAGLKRGADAYLLKPFNEEELYIRLEKLLELRNRLQERYRGLEPTPPSEDSVLQQEDAFIAEIRQVVEANISDEEFGIPELCKAVGVSRTQLHRKIKALTTYSTSHFIRLIRLQKAKFLFKTTNLTISEVAYQVGFKYHTYFTRSFTEEFGQTPKDFIKN